MKKLGIYFGLAAVAIACSTNDEPSLPTCQATTVEDFDGSSSFYNFEKGTDGKMRVSDISVYQGTDSAYSYTHTYIGTLIDEITETDAGQVEVYSATYDGDKLMKLSGMPQGIGIVTDEIRLVYSGNNVAEWQGWAIDTTATLYQYFEEKFTYDTNGDLSKIEFYIDFTMLFTLGFGGSPTAPYTPELVLTTEFGYDNQDAPNPIYQQYNLYDWDKAMLKNVPKTVNQRDADGNLVGSIGFTITYNEQGFPTYVAAGDTFFDITYLCN